MGLLTKTTTQMEQTWHTTPFYVNAANKGQLSTAAKNQTGVHCLHHVNAVAVSGKQAVEGLLFHYYD
jgi:hypothetical protein